MHSDERSVESAHCERRRILNARLCAKRPNRKWITQWLWIGHAAVMWFLKKFPFLSLSGHFPKTWWRVPRRPSAGSMWPGRSTLPPPGRTGAASSQSWMRMKSLVNEPLRPPRRLPLLYVNTKLGDHMILTGNQLSSFILYIRYHIHYSLWSDFTNWRCS